MSVFGHGLGLAPNLVIMGVVRHETRPGMYRFEGVSSRGSYSVDDAQILSPDGDIEGNGSFAKPRNPSPAIGISGPGGQIYIVGFNQAPTQDDDSDDAPEIAEIDDNGISGDKVFRSAGGARLLLKRGGAMIAEGGGGVSITLNPLNNQYAMRASNVLESANGYMASRGRRQSGSIHPETLSTVDYCDRVGPIRTRVRVLHGDIDDDIGGQPNIASGRRQLSIASVTTAGGITVGVIKLRETYNDDGSWVGEGSKYQWGGNGADENAVLGQQLVEWLKKLIDTIKGLKVNTAWGPSTTPLPPTSIELSSLAGELSAKILSRYIFLSRFPSVLGTTTE